ncbi:hypothetical protein HYC85_016960 [Camellia sinensis]|uniref:Uncharacterized protein n=1 Tax=Camellia sinensis TaxID=4442 RepID=A0A7J7H153_CAMSI|nr:hypothetical protein HYC85_016960 [Camellia sinensis]
MIHIRCGMKMKSFELGIMCSAPVKKAWYPHIYRRNYPLKLTLKSPTLSPTIPHKILSHPQNNNIKPIHIETCIDT